MSIFKPPFATAAELDAITLEDGELVWDSTNKTFRMGDGVTLGGVSDPTFIAAGLISDTTYNADQAVQDSRLTANEADIDDLEENAAPRKNYFIDPTFFTLRGETVAVPDGGNYLDTSLWRNNEPDGGATTSSYTINAAGAIEFVSADGGWIGQKTDDILALNGETVTVSAVATSGTIQVQTGASTWVTLTAASPVTFTYDDSVADGFINIKATTMAATIYGLKLEVGSSATSFDPPNETEERLKVAKYFFRVSPLSDRAVGLVYFYSVAYGYVTVNTPTQMKSGGTVSILNTFKAGGQSISVGTGAWVDSNAFLFQIEPSSGSFSGTTDILYSDYLSGSGFIQYDARY